MTQGFKRVLGGLDVFFLAFGAMIGWGWVVLAGGWIESAGFLGAAAAFAAGGVIVSLIGLTYAELASALPYAGGEHVYVERAFGPGASFVATWAIVLGYVSVVAFEAIALPTALVYLFPDLRQIPLWDVAGYKVHLTEVLIGSVAALFITGLNIIGVKAAALVQKVVILVVLGAGALLISGSVLGAGEISGPMIAGASGVAGVLMMVPFLFVGFDVIPQSAEEMNVPRRRIGALLIASIVFATVFYIGVVVAVGLAPVSAGAAPSTVVTADAASALWNSEKAGAYIILAGVAGILTSWNAFLIGGSRAIFAMARAGQLPAFLGRVHPKYGTPHYAIAFIGLLSVLAPVLGRSALVWIVDAGGFGIVLAYIFVAASFVALRVKAPEMERPYRAPAGMIVGWLAVLLSIGLGALYLPGSPAGLVWPQEWAIIGGWIVLGALAFGARKFSRPTGRSGHFQRPS
jgi:basic amino acid/polyamine antiporter, APA family